MSDPETKNSLWPIERSEDIEWERLTEKLTGAQRILPYKSWAFCDALRGENDIDSYLTSPSYYFFTGRKGLWIYKDGGAFVPFCWHPNTPGQVLIFPERGKTTGEATAALLKKLPLPSSGIRLARIKGGFYAPSCREISSSNRSVFLSPVVEQVLDWKYPVRILSTEAVSKMEGPSYRYIRNHVRHIEAAGGSVVELPEADYTEVADFIERWAEAATNIQAETAGLIRLYKYILSLSQIPFVGLKGFVVLIKGQVEALTMWDVSNPDDPTGNRFVNLCNTSYRGMADFTTKNLADRLLKEGVQYLNIGGAETINLDQFKRKFVPAFSVRLESVKVDIEAGFSRQELPSETTVFRRSA